MSDDQKNQQMDPMAPAANGHPRSDEEAANLQSKELKRKKRNKCAIYTAAFAVFQTAIILLFILLVMKIRTPKVRWANMNVQNLVATAIGASSSLAMKLDGLVTVKNTNFGDYRFDAANITFLHQGVTIGQVAIPKTRARARSTKKIGVVVELNSTNIPGSSESGSNLLTLTSQAKLGGKVELLKVFKRKKSAQMNCSLLFDVAEKTLNELTCK